MTDEQLKIAIAVLLFFCWFSSAIMPVPKGTARIAIRRLQIITDLDRIRCHEYDHRVIRRVRP